MRRRTAVPIALVLVSLGLGLTACGSDDKPAASAADATQTMCDQKDNVTQDVATLRAVDPATATVGDVKGAVQAIGTQVDTLGNAAEQVASAQWQDVADAYTHLADVVDGITDSTALTAAAADIDAAKQDVADAWTALFTKVDCSAGS